MVVPLKQPRRFTDEERARFNLARIQEQTVIAALEYCGGNPRDTAALLGIGVRTFYRNWSYLWVRKSQDKLAA